tara:strand:+ start:410 stop:562 length:153 start_codon:yes stop_codon:yes gene_type:complete
VVVEVEESTVHQVVVVLEDLVEEVLPVVEVVLILDIQVQTELVVVEEVLP